MNSHFVAATVYLAGLVALSAAPLDDKLKAFEDAAKASSEVTDKSTPGIYPMGRALTVDDLNMIIQRGSNATTIEGMVARLMATHPAENVQKTGESLLQELEAEKKARMDAFEIKANAILAKVQDALTQAKKPADLDQMLKDLQTLQPRSGSAEDEASSPMMGQINTAFQFVTQWQDYLSAMASDNRPQAQNTLRNILENRQINAPTYFPRSEILARLVEASAEKPKPVPAAPAPMDTDPNVILKKIKKVDDVNSSINKLMQITSDPAWDWSTLQKLDNARLDAVAGLPVVLNFKDIMSGPIWGDDISRIIAMESLAILPYYFGMQESDPPKANETLNDYLDRLSATAGAANNLALLQRVLAVKTAFLTARRDNVPSGVSEFLAGMTQEAAGQYALAVISYEHAMLFPDSYLPVKLLEERLAAIKTAHPQEYQEGYGVFMEHMATSPEPNYTVKIEVLPIPEAVPIPARPPASTSNAAPANPSPPPAGK